MNILILAPYPPYPPHGGGTMRIFQLIRGLARRNTVTCLTFTQDAEAEAALAPLREHCRVIVVRGPPARSLARRAWTTVGSLLPDMALRNASPAYAAALQTLLAQEHFDIVQAESIEMAGYLALVDQRPNGPTTNDQRPNRPMTNDQTDQRPTTNDQSYNGRADSAMMYRRGAPLVVGPSSLVSNPSSLVKKPLRVLDQFNVEYMIQQRAALTSVAALWRARTPTNVVRAAAGAAYSFAQWRKLRAYERRVMRACDLVLAVSEDDARIFSGLTNGTHVGVVPNGVDSAAFSRTAVATLPTAPLPEGAIVFSGTLDYRPNIDAVLWFAEQVLPLIQRALPGTPFVVVGKRPAPALGALHARGTIQLVGAVPEVRPYIAQAAAYVVPMRIGGGVRLKLLEALALEAPVVTTSVGAEGVLGLTDQVHCVIADDPAAFAAATLRLLAAPALGRALGAAGRALVAARYDWDVITPKLERWYAVGGMRYAASIRR